MKRFAAFAGVGPTREAPLFAEISTRATTVMNSIRAVIKVMDLLINFFGDS